MEALAVLDESSEAIAELGESGWVLFGGGSQVVLNLRQLWLDSQIPIRMSFLGDDVWTFKESRTKIPKSERFKEMLVIMACHPDGLSGEQFNDMLGWQNQSTLTLRSQIRNLRAFVPVGTRPYKLLVPVKADFLELEQSLSDGDLDRALELYRGPLMPRSESPFIAEYRDSLETMLRISVMESTDASYVAALALRLGDDLELIEESLRRLPMKSAQRNLLLAQAERVRRNWEED